MNIKLRSLPIAAATLPFTHKLSRLTAAASTADTPNINVAGRSSCNADVIPTAIAKPYSIGYCQIRCGSFNTASNGKTAASNTSAKQLASITSSNKPSWMRLRLL